MIETFLLLVIVAIGLVLTYQIGIFLLAYPSSVLERQYIQYLEPVNRERAQEVPEFLEERREIAMAMGFEYINTYRSTVGRARDLVIDLWLSRDGMTVGMVGECHIWRIPYARTAFYSAFDDGTRLTTQDNFDEGDPLRIRGTEVFYEDGFAQLFRKHEQRIEDHADTPITFSGAKALVSIEDLERTRVDQLVERGWARYRDMEHNAWSYTLSGANEIYFHERSRYIREHKEKMKREQEESSSFE